MSTTAHHLPPITMFSTAAAPTKWWTELLNRYKSGRVVTCDFRETLDGTVHAFDCYGILKFSLETKGDFPELQYRAENEHEHKDITKTVKFLSKEKALEYALWNLQLFA